MADNFCQATIQPFVPKVVWEDIKKDPKFSKYFISEVPDSEVLMPPEEDHSLSEEPHGDDVYLFSEYGINEQAVEILLREVLHRCPKIDHFTVEGAYTCSKMRPGEFGGFCCFVGRRFARWGSTGNLLMRFGNQYKKKMKKRKKPFNSDKWTRENV